MKKTGKAAAAGLAAVLSLCLVIPAWATGSLDDAKKKKSSLEEEKKEDGSCHEEPGRVKE